MGLQLGQLAIVRADRAETLHGLPLEPLVASL
jgi:hypothetical protein